MFYVFNKIIIKLENGVENFLKFLEFELNFKKNQFLMLHRYNNFKL